MKPDRLKQIEDLYHSALKREPERRAQFLKDVCRGDEPLREEVESLLAHQGQSGLMEEHVVEAVAEELSEESKPVEVGSQLGSYHILSLLGKGGMGEVYRARDSRLRREVAIKVLPPSFALDPDRSSRFEREARLLASLNHPNIATIHGLEEYNGTPFLVLELVEGDTLQDRLRNGAIRVEESLTLALQIAEALEAAHEKGVIHRDLKPANIKVTPDGKVKVLDFGLAKALWRDGQDQDLSRMPTASEINTEEGQILGTPGYMSPEQVRGQPAGTRSDVWAFGCLLYEMLSGRAPFRADTLSDTLARILEREPDWAALPRETPEQLRSLLQQFLQKDMNRRFDNFGEARTRLEECRMAALRSRWVPHKLRPIAAAALLVLLALPLSLNLGGLREWISGNGGAAEVRSVAVLPLENLSGDSEQDYFAEGMHEALVTDLAKISNLRVVARQSTMPYRGTNTPLAQVAEELGVDALVTGSVLLEDDRSRVTLQLVSAADEGLLWSDRYERELRNILALQDAIVMDVTREIRVELTPDEQILLSSAREVDPEAHGAYLKGMFQLQQYTPERFELGIAYLEQAIGLDPENPLPYAGLAQAYGSISHGPGAQADAVPLAREAALKALELDETLPEVHEALALIQLYHDWDWSGAERSFQRALALNPNLSLARSHYGWYLGKIERWEEGLAEMRRAAEADPLAPLWPAFVGWAYVLVGRHEEAIQEAQKSLELNPRFPVGLYTLGLAYSASGMYQEAIAAHQQAGAVSVGWKWGLGQAYALAGRTEEALEVAAELEARNKAWDNWGLAEIYSALGDVDTALRWLAAACDERHAYVIGIQENPAFDPLRDDPRFQELVVRLN